ncbi:MAG: FCD domain-containing protein [Elainellaceae cyanobacterium]
MDSPTSQPLHELIYLNLRSSILVGDIGPSDRLIESRLAERMQVSRTPIREAIRRLQQEGLLTTDPANGITPVEIFLGDAIHLYDCRIALEALAVEGACRHATPEQIETLRRILDDADAVLQQTHYAGSTMTTGDSALRQRDLNYAFHRLIAESSQNPWLVSLLDQLANQVKLLRLQILQTPVDVGTIQSEHWLIVEAIAQRDAVAAAEHIRHHLEISKTRISKALGRQAQQEQAANRTSDVVGTVCPRCGSQQLRKNGRRKTRQNYLCKACGRQFLGE